MKHKTVKSFAGGTSLVGYVTTTRQHIESVFGEPQEYGEGDKVTTEWHIEFENGEHATIYDWKRYEWGAPDFDEIYEWHIGGRNKEVLPLVIATLDKRQGGE